MSVDPVTMKTEIEVRWMSWGECLAEPLGDETAIIYVLNPGMDSFHQRSKHELVLSFWDRFELPLSETILVKLFGSRPELCVSLRRLFLGDNGGWPWRPPLADDARRIREFVDQVAPSVQRFVIACEFGKSRSRAIGEWLAATRGYQPVGDRAHGTANVILADLLFNQG